MKDFNKFIEEAASKRCPAGQYYCHTDQKCKPIPKGYRIGYGGYLRNDKDDDDGNGKKKNGNGGNGNGGNRSGTAVEPGGLLGQAPLEINLHK